MNQVSSLADSVAAVYDATLFLWVRNTLEANYAMPNHFDIQSLLPFAFRKC